MSKTAFNAADNTKNKQLIGMLLRSRLFRDYEGVFTKATGLPLVLRPLEFWQLAHHGKKHENPFCALLAENPATLSVCLQAHQDMIEHTGLIPHSVPCPFGLTETAVPVKFGVNVIGYLRIGQVLRHLPAKSDATKVSRALERCGVPFKSEIRKAWERNPLIPPDRYNATVRLLSFFAEQLSSLANQLVIESQNIEPPLCTRCARVHREAQDGAHYVRRRRKSSRCERLPFLQSFSQSDRFKVYRLRCAGPA